MCRANAAPAMSTRVTLTHITCYRYAHPVHLGPQLVRLRPAPHCRCEVEAYALGVEPVPHFIHWQQDPFANHQARLVFPEATERLELTVTLTARLTPFNPFDFFLDAGAEQVPFNYGERDRWGLAPYLTPQPLTPAMAGCLKALGGTPMPTIEFLVELNRRLCQHIRYVHRAEAGVQDPEQTLTLAQGSCRDSGWLLVQLLRHLGLAARFVSGYLVQVEPDARGTISGPTELHAWCEAYLPGAGWVGLDPTSGLLAGAGHIPLACAPEPSGAAPVEGAVDPCEMRLDHQMRVEHIESAPGVRP